MQNRSCNSNSVTATDIVEATASEKRNKMKNNLKKTPRKVSTSRNNTSALETSQETQTCNSVKPSPG